MDEIAETWGPDLMKLEESARLEALLFPLTVYRGDTLSPDQVATGVSWTLNLDIARFYAEVWPKRRGCQKPAVVLSLSVERDE